MATGTRPVCRNAASSSSSSRRPGFSDDEDVDDDDDDDDDADDDDDDDDDDDNHFAEIIRQQALGEQAEAAREAEKGATAVQLAAAGGGPAAAPAVGPGLPGRSHARDAEFRAQARLAFDAMELHGDSRLPQAQVLARDPDAPSGGRDKCPRPLWDLIKSHGGYIEEGRFGVSRRRIIGQFNQWRVSKFSVAGARLVAPSITREDMQAVLGQVVPGVDVLIAETAAFRDDYSSASNCRQKSSAVEVWASDECRRFWEAQRARIIHILLDAALDHPTKAGYVETHTHAHDAYTELSAILTMTNAVLAAQLAAGGCDFCCEAVKGVATCDCIAVVADEAVDMFIGKVLAYVGDYSGGDAKAFSSPPEHAVVPIASTDALYNIAGALLFKVTKKTYASARGVGDDDRNSCVAFVVVHSLQQEAARRAGLPVDKVVSTQYSVNSLTYVSVSLYKFFCRLEVLYWYNMNLRPNADLVADTLIRLDKFAREDKGVILAWRRCMQDVVRRVLEYILLLLQ